MRYLKPAFFGLAALLLVGVFFFRTRYAEITEKPPRAYSSAEFSVPESVISTQLRFEYADLESVIEDFFSTPFEDEGEGEFKRKYQAKAKNPLYDPVEWMKTKNPLYNPTKWLKGFGIKTKNPLFNPTEWIKAKNPRYDPNQWIYADVAEIEIGYRYRYQVDQRGPVTVEPIGNEILRITAPLEVHGNVGFRGALAKIGQVEKKSFKANADVRLDIAVDFSPDWCPRVETDLNILWNDGPALEISGGVWLDLKAPAMLMSPTFESDVSRAIEKAINCDEIRSELAQFLTPTSVRLSALENEFFLNIVPLGVSTSGLLLDASALGLQVATRFEIEVADEGLPPSSALELSRLEIATGPTNLLRVSVPLRLRYDQIETALNKELEAINAGVGHFIAGGPSILRSRIEDLQVTSFEVYPTGEYLAIGAEFRLKATHKLFSTNGRLYLSAKPVVSDAAELHLSGLRLATEVDNPLYPSILAIFRDSVVPGLKRATATDLGPFIEQGERVVLEEVKRQLAKVNGLALRFEQVSVDLSEDFLFDDRRLAKFVYINAGFEVEIEVESALSSY
ncbi:MAG: DUF4403 family protein [Acidobacteriota bacterium]